MRLYLTQSPRIHPGTLGGPGCVKLAQYEMAAQQYAANRADRIERLRDVEPSCGRLLRPHTEYQRIGRGLKHSATAGHHVYGEKEERIARRLSGRIEKHRPGGVKDKTEDDARLVGETPYEKRSRKSDAEICAEESELDERRLQVAHRHYALESGKERVVHIVGHAP